MVPKFTYYEEAETLEELSAKVKATWPVLDRPQSASGTGAPPKAAPAPAAQSPKAEPVSSPREGHRQDRDAQAHGAVCPDHGRALPSTKGPKGSLFCPERVDDDTAGGPALYCKWRFVPTKAA